MKTKPYFFIFNDLENLNMLLNRSNRTMNKLLKCVIHLIFKGFIVRFVQSSTCCVRFEEKDKALHINPKLMTYNTLPFSIYSFTNSASFFSKSSPRRFLAIILPFLSSKKFIGTAATAYILAASFCQPFRSET